MNVWQDLVQVTVRHHIQLIVPDRLQVKNLKALADVQNVTTCSEIHAGNKVCRDASTGKVEKQTQEPSVHGILAMNDRWLQLGPRSVIRVPLAGVQVTHCSTAASHEAACPAHETSHASWRLFFTADKSWRERRRGTRGTWENTWQCKRFTASCGFRHRNRCMSKAYRVEKIYYHEH